MFTDILTVVGIIIVTFAVSVVFACLFAWMGMAPLALCLEGDGKDNGRFLRRTYDLMCGNWWRIFGLVSLVGLAILGLIVILMGMASAIVGLGTLKEVTSGHISPSSMIELVAGYVGSFSLVSHPVVSFLLFDVGFAVSGLKSSQGSAGSGMGGA